MARHEAGPRRSQSAAGALLLAAALCGGLARSAWAQMGDVGGGASGGGNLPAAGEPAPSAGSLLQGGPPQPDGFSGFGGSGDLSAVPGQSMRDRINSALGLQQTPSNASQPAWQFVPAVSLQQGWTSNAQGIPGAAVAGQPAYITIVNPSLAVTFDSVRLQGGVAYAPTLTVYEPNRGETSIAQNLSGHAHATLLPDLLFVDLSGVAMQQTITGSLGPTGTLVPSNSNTAQDYSFSLTPYLLHQFGTFGTGELGGSIGETAQLVNSGTFAAVQPGLPPTAIASQHATSTEEHIAFTSGSGFGRWLSQAYISASQESGTGVLDGAFHNTLSYEAGYAITRRAIALATIGWDDLHYAGVPPVNVNSPLWNVGVQFLPNPDSTITLRYGRKDGIDAPFVSAVYTPTARTRLTANYSVTISTDQQQLGNDLAAATLDNTGAQVNANTGQPLLASNNFLGLMTSVYRLEQASITGSLLLDRDTLLLGINHSREKSLNIVGSSNTQLPDVTGTSGQFSWSHDMSLAVKTTVFLQYGVTESSFGATRQSSDVFVGGAQVAYLLSNTLSATLQYSHTYSTFRSPIPLFSSDFVLAGVRKTF